MQGPRGVEVLLARVERCFGQKNQGYFFNYYLPMTVNRQKIMHLAAVCQTRIRKFLGLPDPNSDPSIYMQKVKKPWFTPFCTYIAFNFLSLKTDVNVPTTSNIKTFGNNLFL
jgi:hypothetical protein